MQRLDFPDDTQKFYFNNKTYKGNNVSLSDK